MNATCLRCPRELVPQRAWAKASSTRRAGWTAVGKAIHQGHGLCRGCYLKAYRAGEIPPAKPGVGGRGRTKPGKPCVRCGIASDRELCRDCRDVEAA